MFCKKLKNFDSILIIASFDVVSLFTNIPWWKQLTYAFNVEDKYCIDGLINELTLFVKCQLLS